jgi:Tol biopolymer transport system component/DNA-binding winged helix-turn-helix (wHTH) protein
VQKPVTHRIIRLGEFTVDPSAKVLFRDGQPVALPREAAETLLVLAERAGQIVAKEELTRLVCPGQVADDANLDQHIALVRNALSVANGHPAFIESIGDSGYRMAGPALPGKRGKHVRWWIAAALATFAVLLFGYWRYAGTRGAEASIAKLTRMPGREFQPTLSPDGAWVAFLSSGNDRDAAGLYVQSTAGGQPLLLFSSTSLLSSPSWHADGQQVYVLSLGEKSTTLHSARVPDGHATRVRTLNYALPSEPYRMAEVAPDGATLAAVDTTGGASHSGLVLLTPNAPPRQLTKPGGDALMDAEPRFSPNGRSLTFLRVYHRSRQELFRLDLSNGNLLQLTNDGRQVSSQSWSRDGASVIFASDRHGEFRLWSVAASGGTPKPLPVYGEFPIHFSLARNSDELAYSALVEDRNIWCLRLKDLSWTPIAHTTGQDASPRYSPDGKRICFRSDRSGSEQLWVSDADGSNPVPVTSDPMRASVGNWSPDGKGIVFNHPLTRDVYLARETAPRQWSVSQFAAKGIHPVFAPAGGAIILATTAGIERHDLDGGTRRTLAPVKASALSLSPDGKVLYFVPHEQNTTLHAIPVEGGPPRPVQEGLIPGCTSCFAAANHGIYVLLAEGGAFHRQTLWFQDFRAHAIKPVIPYPEPLWPQGSGPFSLSPDGESLMLVRVDARVNSDILIVKPFQ